MKIYTDSPSVPMLIRGFKYLSKVFSCQLRHIDTDCLSEDLLENLDLSAGSSDQKHILVVHVLDNSMKYDSTKAKFSSSFPMKFYALGKDDLDDQLRVSGPITFKNMVPEGDLAAQQ